MNAFNKQFDDYRIRLGVGVALSYKIRKEPNVSNLISDKLTESDLNRLLSAAADSDRTVRIYATDFLTALGDPRATKLAIDRAAKTKNEDTQYFWLLAAQSGWRRLSEPEKTNFLQLFYDTTKFQTNNRSRELIAKMRQE